MSHGFHIGSFFKNKVTLLLLPLIGKERISPRPLIKHLEGEILFLQETGTMLLGQFIYYVSGECGHPEERKGLKPVGEEKLQQCYTRMNRKHLSYEKQSQDNNL